MYAPQMVWVGVASCGCVEAFHDPAMLTPQESLALRSQYEREGLAVSLVPARKAIMRFCQHGRIAPQTDLFSGVTP
jgi:hypothetical protein